MPYPLDTTHDITLRLTERQVKHLEELVSVYLEEGGPAWECMQEWDEPYSAEESEQLASAIKHTLLTRLR